MPWIADPRDDKDQEQSQRGSRKEKAPARHKALGKENSKQEPVIRREKTWRKGDLGPHCSASWKCEVIPLGLANLCTATGFWAIGTSPNFLLLGQGLVKREK